MTAFASHPALGASVFGTIRPTVHRRRHVAPPLFISSLHASRVGVRPLGRLEECRS